MLPVTEGHGQFTVGFREREANDKLFGKGKNNSLSWTLTDVILAFDRSRYKEMKLVLGKCQIYLDP